MHLRSSQGGDGAHGRSLPLPRFAFPIRSLDESTEDLLFRFELGGKARLGLQDPVIQALGAASGRRWLRPEATSRLFVDHVLFAMRAHSGLALRHPGGSLLAAGRAHDLASSARSEFIDAHLASNISLADVARECQLSVAQFARSFRRSTGMPPHRYLTERRVERARTLLLHSDLPLADVAVRCGFADQSHFAQGIRRLIGVSPGRPLLLLLCRRVAPEIARDGKLGECPEFVRLR